jgi:hypothetical protein
MLYPIHIKVSCLIAGVHREPGDTVELPFKEAMALVSDGRASAGTFPVRALRAVRVDDRDVEPGETMDLEFPKAVPWTRQGRVVPVFKLMASSPTKLAPGVSLSEALMAHAAAWDGDTAGLLVTWSMSHLKNRPTWPIVQSANNFRSPTRVLRWERRDRFGQPIPPPPAHKWFDDQYENLRRKTIVWSFFERFRSKNDQPVELAAEGLHPEKKRSLKAERIEPGTWARDLVVDFANNSLGEKSGDVWWLDVKMVAAPPVVATTGAIQACQRWLASMKDGVPTKPKNKYRAAAVAKFKRLSGRGFDHAWSEAFRDAPQWTKAGRRKKRNQITTPK